MSRERSDVILKIIVKHFFIEKEVTSTLIMDALYSGLRALELQSMKNKKWREVRLADLEELPPPMVWVEQDMFVLADDVMSLLERAVLEQVPYQTTPPGKDDKVSQNRTTKVGSLVSFYFMSFFLSRSYFIIFNFKTRWNIGSGLCQV